MTTLVSIFIGVGIALAAGWMMITGLYHVEMLREIYEGRKIREKRRAEEQSLVDKIEKMQVKVIHNPGCGHDQTPPTAH